MNEQNNRLVAGAVRVLAIIGFIAVILIGVWGSLSLARGVPGAFSSLAAAIVSLTSVFVPANETLTVSPPEGAVASGETFLLTFTHNQRSADGSYAFRFSCADGVSFSSATASSGTTEKVACETSFEFLNANNSIVLTPVSTKSRFVDVPVVIDFTPEGAAAPTVSGSAIVTIENSAVVGSPAAGGTVPRTPGKETTTIDVISPGVSPSDPNGAADLAARFIELGVVDKDTGVFTASSTPSKSAIGKRVAARFAVENLGTKTSPQWTFNAVLPTFPAHIFSSPVQQALAPGDRIEFTLGFDSFEEDNEGILIVNVDPTGSINERNKDNNLLRSTITVTN